MISSVEFVGSFSFENKYCGHLYGITEISFIVVRTAVTLKLAIFQSALWSIQSTKGILQITMFYSNLTSPEPQYPGQSYPRHLLNTKEPPNYQNCGN